MAANAEFVLPALAANSHSIVNSDFALNLAVNFDWIVKSDCTFSVWMCDFLNEDCLYGLNFVVW